jgi:hypothetical protein
MQAACVFDSRLQQMPVKSGQGWRRTTSLRGLSCQACHFENLSLLLCMLASVQYMPMPYVE